MSCDATKNCRLAHIRSQAQDIFGDKHKADEWLRRGLHSLGGKAPLEMAETDDGADIVERALAAISWGAPA